ncbi:FKBP-type peptidyl-prolyl cis-trans isomerase [Candidatus Micrarchaeota archaeon]|nr:FKBP-type peptidyl-prolyl cis-trans isomerase [Candidatus Micrarchaeota archaeon]
MRSYIVLALLAIVLAGCVNPPVDGGNQTTQPPVMDVAPGQNNTGQNVSVQPQQNQSTVLAPGDSVSLGDHVWVDYTLWVQGKVLDTSNATLANESGILNPNRQYKPLDFEVQFNKGLIDGFIINVINMHVNETVSFDVDPARGYGPYDPAKVIVVPRFYTADRYIEQSLYETVPRSYFTQQGINVSNGTGFDTPYGTVFITDFNDENVTIFYLLVPGANITVGGVPQQVVALSNLTAKMELMLEENGTYALPDPILKAAVPLRVVNKTNDSIVMERMLIVNRSYKLAHPYTLAPTTFLVKDVADTNITLDGNHPLANETLHFQVTLLNATRPSN